ncbi:MAG: hypothetical protein ACI9XK_001280 [Granulosicoccus sp.]|jgi:hypothetical protein
MFYRLLFLVGLSLQSPFLLASTSQETGGVLVMEAKLTSKPSADPSPPTQQDQPALHILKTYEDHPANTCVGSVASLSPVHDVGISSGQLTNTSPLIVAGNLQYAYLQFDLTDVPVSPVDLALQLFTEQTDDSTILSAYQANSSAWTESSTTQQLPYPSVLLGSALLTFHNAAYQSIYLKREMLSSGPESVVLSVINDSSNVLIRSTESQFEPRLKITGTDDFCSLYTANRQARLANEASDEFSYDTLQNDAPVVSNDDQNVVVFEINSENLSTPSSTEILAEPPVTLAENLFVPEGSDSDAGNEDMLTISNSVAGAFNPLFAVFLLLTRRWFRSPGR